MMATADKIRILHLMTACTVGGLEMHVLALLRGLDPARYDRSVGFFRARPDNARSLVGDFRKAGVAIHDLGAKAHWDLRAIARLWRLLRRQRYDILHVHSPFTELVGIPLGRLARIPIICSTVHNSEPIYQNRLFANVVGSFYRKVNRVVAISDAVQFYLRSCVRLSGTKLVRIYYGLSLKCCSFFPSRSEELPGISLDGANLVIGVIARLAPQKGHRFLLEAMSDVVRHEPTVKLLVVGHDTFGLRSELGSLSSALGLNQHIVFTGFRSDVDRILARLDLLVLPSLWEGFGLVLLEAMAAGAPIVATTVGPIPEIVVHGETGLLVPPGSSNALASAIVSLARDPDLRARMGIAGRKRLETHFTADQMIRATEQLYEEELKNNLFPQT